jgi:starch synthase
MEQTKIWFTVSEAQGLVKSGGLADVAKALPKALQELGHDVSIAIPGYSILPGFYEAEEVLSTKLNFWPNTPYKVRKLQLDGVPVYAIECAQYFDRPQLYAEHNTAYADNGERFGFFCAAALDCLPKLGIHPDVIHANDWHTGLVPFLLKNRYRDDDFFSTIKSVLTVHNAVFQGIYSYEELRTIPELQAISMEHLRYSHSHVGMLRAGLAYADKINAVSPNYAQELLTAVGSHGLVDDFNRRIDDLCGILNGCDYSEWDPQTDEFLPLNYSADTESMLKGKQAAKEVLQAECHLPCEDKPLFGMVCRLTHQKGFDYILPILDQFLRNDVQIVIVGTGDPKIADNLRSISANYPDKFTFIEAYSNRFAHLVEAGSDFFLMPSEFEACGLNQIYSMAYGTLPIVREVGGLKDTVIDVDIEPENATGFSFHYPLAKDLLITMQRALIFYLQQPEQMQETQLRAMQRNFSWQQSAIEYEDMYRKALGR